MVRRGLFHETEYRWHILFNICLRIETSSEYPLVLLKVFSNALYTPGVEDIAHKRIDHRFISAGRDVRDTESDNQYAKHDIERREVE